MGGARIDATRLITASYDRREDPAAAPRSAPTVVAGGDQPGRVDPRTAHAGDLQVHVVGDARVARLQATGLADLLADADRLALPDLGDQVEDPRHIADRRIGDLHVLQPLVVGIGEPDLGHEAGNRRLHGLADVGDVIHALMLAGAAVAARAEFAIAEGVMGAHTLAGGIDEVVLAVAIDIDAPPDQSLLLLRRQGQRRDHGREGPRRVGDEPLLDGARGDSPSLGPAGSAGQEEHPHQRQEMRRARCAADLLSFH